MTGCYNFSLVCLLTICFIIPFNECLEANPLCNLPPQLGSCNDTITRYAFMPQRNRCEKFSYSGCGGNNNSFPSAEECLNTCGGEPSVEDPQCDRSKCNWRRFAHYLVKKCTPIYQGGSCCPIRFQCNREMPKSNVKCFYKDKVYNAGDTIQVEDPCVSECSCSSGYNDEPASFDCGVAEPKDLTKPNCRLIYSEDSCYPVSEDCSNRDPDSFDCKWNEETYFLGDIMYFEEFPCQICICTPGFDGPKGPGCSKIDCHWELRYREDIANGCSPVHFEDSCCPTDWVCPGDSFLSPPSSDVPAQEVNSSSAVCTIGDRTVPVGSSIQHEDRSIRCTCIIPPDLTCDQHRHCKPRKSSSSPASRLFHALHKLNVIVLTTLEFVISKCLLGEPEF